MMKIIKIKIALSLALTVVLSSCHLNQLPSSDIENKDAFKTYQDAVKFANGMTSYYRNTQYGAHAWGTEVQGDLFNASSAFNNHEGDLHSMGPQLKSNNPNLAGVWEGLYKGISSVNNFLANIDNVTPANSTEQAAIKRFIGQAHYYRAAYYHALVRLYAKPYQADELGVPIVLKVDITAKPNRSTIGEVYAQIDADIIAARLNLANTPGVAGAVEPTIDAVKALDARVHLDTRDYEGAHAIASELLASDAYDLARNLTQMEDEWYRDNGTESIFQMYASLTEGVNSNSLGYINYVSSLNVYRPDYLPTKSCLEMYIPGDLRYQAWFGRQDCLLDNVPYSLVLFKKYQGNPELEVSPSRFYAHKPKVFTIAEMYLISAESLAMLGRTAEAKVTINALQKARGAYATDGSLASIQKEWAKETIGQGLRINCLKRWNLGYSGRVPQLLDAVTQGPNFNLKDSPAGNNLFTWGIPDRDREVNKNLIQNQGW